MKHGQWDERVCRLANAMSKIGLLKGIARKWRILSTITPEDIFSYCGGKIAGYKVPKDIISIKDDEMPRSATGKILHRVLRDRYGTRIAYPKGLKGA